MGNTDFILPGSAAGIGKEIMAILFVRGYSPTVYVTTEGSFYNYSHDGVFMNCVWRDPAIWTVYAKKSGKYKILTCGKVTNVATAENKMTEEVVQVEAGGIIATFTNPSDPSSYSAKIVIAL